MANLFEKPIAANPMSEFVELPMDFIANAVQRRQARFDQAKAMVNETEDSLLGLKFLPGDRDRHMAIQQGYDDRMNKMIEDADGDYSLITAGLDNLKRDMKRDMSYGELAAHSSAYASGMKMKEAIDKRALEGKTSVGGQAIFNQKLMSHKSLPNDSGGYDSFQGYNPSSIVNVVDHLTKMAKDINEEYDPDGNKLISPDMVAQDIYANMLADPNVEKSIRESAISNGIQGEEDYSKFKLTMINNVVEKIAYDEISKRTGTGGAGNDTPMGTTLLNIQVPRVAGDGKYEGGSMAFFKQLSSATRQEFQDNMSTKEGKRLVRHLSLHADTPFPDTYYKQVEWLDDNMSKERTGQVTTRPPTRAEKAAIDGNGNLAHPDSSIIDKSGNILE